MEIALEHGFLIGLIIGLLLGIALDHAYCLIQTGLHEKNRRVK